MNDLYLEAARKAAVTAIEKHGSDVILFNLKQYPTVTDYAVLVTSRSRTHARGLSWAIEDDLEALGLQKRGVESDEKGLWILLDYYGLVIHIFDPEERHYYNLERLWKEVKTERFEELIRHG